MGIYYIYTHTHGTIQLIKLLELAVPFTRDIIEYNTENMYIVTGGIKGEGEEGGLRKRTSESSGTRAGAPYDRKAMNSIYGVYSLIVISARAAILFARCGVVCSTTT